MRDRLRCEPQNPLVSKPGLPGSGARAEGEEKVREWEKKDVSPPALSL